MVSIGAIMYGISSLERHITLDRTMYGSDQAASLEEKGMEMLVKGIDKILLAMGTSSVGNIHEDEIKIAKKLRAHLISHEK